MKNTHRLILINILEMEEWKDIEGYEGLYQVSSYGRVKSLDRIVEAPCKWGGTRKMKFKEVILKPSIVSKHLHVKLSISGIEANYQVHRLVAEAFIPNTHDYDVVHHIDHNPLNNNVENLVWVSSEQHYIEHLNERSEGVKKSKSITIYQYTLDCKLVAIWKSAAEAKKQLGFDDGAISKCCKGKIKQYKGYIWSYTPL